MNLADQTIVITGAAQGPGAAIARRLAGQGARPFLMDQDADQLAQTMANCPGAQGIVVDLFNADATAAAIAQVRGHMSTLIHDAAILKVGPVDVVSLSTFQATLNAGIQAAFQLTQAVWPGMKAKHALEGFLKCLAMEGAPHGIASCTITPGHLMHTPMSETTYGPDQRAKWIDPIHLAPAFAMLRVTDRCTCRGSGWTHGNCPKRKPPE